jgi:hypothetical protein
MGQVGALKPLQRRFDPCGGAGFDVRGAFSRIVKLG